MFVFDCNLATLTFFSCPYIAIVLVNATNNYSSVMKTVTSPPDGRFIQKPMDSTITPGKTGTAEVYVLQNKCIHNY